MDKIAAIQMNSTANVTDNLNQAATLIRDAANKGATLIALPEMFATLGLSKQQVYVHSEVIDADDFPIQAFLKQCAIDTNTWIVGGTVPTRTSATAKCYATCLVYNNKGQRVTHYHKNHLFDVVVAKDEQHVESDSYQCGDSICTFDSPLGKIGLAVCYDLRFPELTRQYFAADVDIIVVPAAFTQTTGAAHWDILSRCRAIENQCYLVAPCQIGTQANGKATYGHSCIIDPWGTVVAHNGTDAGCVLADINHALIQKIRRNMPSRRHARVLNRLLQRNASAANQ